MNTDIEYQLQKLSLLLAQELVNERISIKQVVQLMERDKYCTGVIIDFWKSYNSTTKAALDKLITEKCRLHLQNCMDIPSVEHP